MRYLNHILLLLILFIEFNYALPEIDNTCMDCDRRYLDSLNVYNRRSIRVNQVGFRPQDLHKYAFVADPTATSFKVIDASNNEEAWSGNLSSLGVFNKPNIWVNGAFNSISQVYDFGSNSPSSNTETLYRADFSSLTKPGRYYLVVGTDTSATFWLHDAIFNAIFENSLKFFGVNRCGDTHSQLHGPCHLQDGSEIGHDLTGGWHDCGDHFKVSQTLGYAAYVLAMTYNVYQDKAEDRYGKSYDDTVFTDGIPDVLYEAKIGVDYIYKLYKASKKDGLIDQGDMYHSVGVAMPDHLFWDVPEKQDAQSPDKGGPDRVVGKGIGSNVAGVYIAAMTHFAMGWEVFDADYSQELIEAAKEIYAKVLKPNYPKNTDDLNGFYTGGGEKYDDAAAAALGLWYATKDTIYAFDLYKNTAINDNATNYLYNLPYFRGGFMGHQSGFYPGGWMTDYENVHAYVLFSFAKLILPTEEIAQSYGISESERDTLMTRIIATFTRLTDDGSQGDSIVSTNAYGNFTVEAPYNLVWTSSDWGFNRYNMGATNAVFMLYDITKDEQYLKVALDNIYYNLGANPWDISFLMGAGDKNLNHPHNRAANPDGYNAGGLPYAYKCPRGALMGGAHPEAVLLDDWEDYTATETCIDFSAQLIIPAQSLAKNLPPDNEGPLFSNIHAVPISDTSAIISWDTDEIAKVTVFYGTTTDPSKALNKSTPSASKGGSLQIDGLQSGVTYYFFLEGIDVRRNISTDDNHGYWYSFTMDPVLASIEGLTICQVDNRSAKIYWWTPDAMTNGLVRYGTSPNNLDKEQIGNNGQAVLFHEVSLQNLSPNTTYHFVASSGASTSAPLSFKTTEHATLVDLEIVIKPTTKNTNCTDYKDCNTFFFIVTNQDTVHYTDLELRLYLSAPAVGTSYNSSIWDGTGQMKGAGNLNIGSAVPDAVSGGYYLPITLKGNLAVSGSYMFELMLSTTYSSLENSWSLRPHLNPDDPVPFVGIDLTKGPLYTGTETTYLEKVNGKNEFAYTQSPYVAAYYHGKHIYGYTPDYTPESGPATPKNIDLTFNSPFVSPRYSLEKTTYETNYAGESSVSPTGNLDAFEYNGSLLNVLYDPPSRKDHFFFGLDTVLSYGNNYIEWVSWDNRYANLSNSYDCACTVVRTNVEIDTITTPLIPRFFYFSPDSILVYENKRIELQVVMTDSIGDFISDEEMTISLFSDDSKVQFWSSPTSTQPITNIPLKNGMVTIYVSAPEANKTHIYADAYTSSSVYKYHQAVAFLNIEELPPWPIIDVAKIIDTDCDGLGDAIEITLSNEYQNGQKFEKILFTYQGHPYETSDAVIQGKVLTAKISIQDSSSLTNPSGSLVLISKIDGKSIEHADFYTDGISPHVLSVSVLERLPEAIFDRVFIEFSEPILSPDAIFPLNLYSSDKALTDANPQVLSASLYNDSLNVWVFDISFSDDESSVVQEGMYGQLQSESSIKDLAQNGVSDCPQAKLPISLKILPVPLTYASISDANEDGLAEHIRLVFSRPVDERHKPDHVSIIFGVAPAETLSTNQYNFINDSIATINLNPAFSHGNTHGPYQGSYQGRPLLGAGKVIQHKGSGATYESNSILAEDLAGPVLVSSTIQEASFYNLSVIASEPLNTIDSSLEILQRERSGPLPILEKDFSSFNLINNNSQMSIFYPLEVDAIIKEGDRIRLSSFGASAFTDKSGNFPVTDNPWVSVIGAGNPKIKFSVKLKDFVSQIKANESSPYSSPSRTCMYNYSSSKLDCFINNSLVESIDTTQNPLNGVVWEIKLDVPRGSANSEDPAWDSLLLQYDIPVYTNLGAFVQRFSEDLVIPSHSYFSSTGALSLFVEWAPRRSNSLLSVDKKNVGTGAYITKIDLKTKFFPNPNKDKETIERFSNKSTYDKTLRFGIQRKK